MSPHPMPCLVPFPWHCDPKPMGDVVVAGNDIVTILVVILLGLLILALIRRLF